LPNYERVNMKGLKGVIVSYNDIYTL